ncbi:glycosyltransferase family 4 protein [Limibaculum sp. M0105]|uniref:Glycosyltransferase family 4 protein n=1 Tax=Thermohalobaculum xanthum TaxID=2753746 RepID=A0A8J7M6Q5_9RHOB|nr:glycosyltransferase family 4 protein [Thermohalobaculum xanthum]MBK0398730.1 glycosyltransferase family 4 protein [Thermohalobaculum xanthum]
MADAAEGKRVKLCVTGLRGLPGVMGGVETHSEQLYPRIASMGDALEIVVLGRRGYVEDGRREWRGVVVQPLWAVRNKYLETLLHTAASIFHARFREHADVIHIHAVGSGLLTPLARMLGMRVLATHHGQDYKREKWNAVAKFALRTGEALSALSANRIITVSASSARALAARFPSRSKAILHIPNGASLPEPTRPVAEILAEFGLTPGGYILAVGRLDRGKRFQDLIAAHAKVPDAPPLLIAGGADHEDRFTRDLTAKASERVIFAGRRSLEDLGALYRACGLFVLPSAHEGLPISALEALVAGAPMLLSDIGPNLDLGLPPECYFRMGAVDELAGKLAQRDSHLGYEVFRPKSNDLVRQYDWNEVASRTRDVIMELAIRDGSGPRPRA